MYELDLIYLICIYACRRAVYLGAYNEEEAAARAYDLAALKYWGPTTYTNFPVCTNNVFFYFLNIIFICIQKWCDILVYTMLHNMLHGNMVIDMLLLHALYCDRLLTMRKNLR
jgi:hypothetical protein